MKIESQCSQKVAPAAPPGALPPVSPPGLHGAVGALPGEQPLGIQDLLGAVRQDVVTTLATCIETQICAKVGNTVNECFVAKRARDPPESSGSNWPSEGAQHASQNKTAGSAGTP